MVYSYCMQSEEYVINKTIDNYPNAKSERLATQKMQVQVRKTDNVQSVMVKCEGKTTDDATIDTNVIVDCDHTAIFIHGKSQWIRVNNLNGEIQHIDND